MALSNAERQRRYRLRRKSKGMETITVYAPKALKNDLKQHLKDLINEQQNQQRKYE